MYRKALVPESPELQPPVCNFIKEETSTKEISYKFCESFKNSYFAKHPRQVLLIFLCSSLSRSFFEQWISVKIQRICKLRRLPIDCIIKYSSTHSSIKLHWKIPEISSNYRNVPSAMWQLFSKFLLKKILEGNDLSYCMSLPCDN